MVVLWWKTRRVTSTCTLTLQVRRNTDFHLIYCCNFTNGFLIDIVPPFPLSCQRQQKRGREEAESENKRKENENGSHKRQLTVVNSTHLFAYKTNFRTTKSYGQTWREARMLKKRAGCNTSEVTQWMPFGGCSVCTLTRSAEGRQCLFSHVGRMFVLFIPFFCSVDIKKNYRFLQYFLCIILAFIRLFKL